MKILHAYKDFDPPVRGGMERHIALMCRYQRDWADVAALCCSRTLGTRTVDRDGTRVTEVGEWGRFQSAPFAPLYPYHMKRMNADVLVIHVPNPTAEISYLLVRPSARLVVRYHSDVIRQEMAMRLYRPVLMKFLARADIILPTSELYRDTSPILGSFKDRCRVVPLGIVVDAFTSPDPGRVESLRTRYGGKFVLFLGRHRYYKGIEYLVRAAQAIDGQVVIAGDGPERAAAESLARGLNVSVSFPGELSDEELVNYLHACTVFAFPSVERTEAFGISILEAHACGKPVVATTLGTGVEYANLHEKTGLNVAPKDSGALATAINRLLIDTEMAHRLGEYGRERVTREFDARRVAEREFALYQEVLECSKTGT